MAHPWCKGEALAVHLTGAQQSLKKYNASRKLKKVRAGARARLGLGLGLGLGLEVQGLSIGEEERVGLREGCVRAWVRSSTTFLASSSRRTWHQLTLIPQP